MYHRLRWLVIGLLSLLLLNPMIASAQSSTPADALRALNEHLDKAQVAAASGDLVGAKTEVEAFHTGWVSIEDAVREQNPGAYAAIEGALGEAEVALDTGDAKGISAAIHELDEASDAYINSGASGAANPASTITLADTLPLLQEADDALAKGDPATAVKELLEFQRAWPLVESDVRGRSPEVYESTETDLPRAIGFANRGDLASAREIVARLQANLTPLSTTTRYGIFDATVILLREGLEAILIIGALLAFLSRSGNHDKRGWVLGGGLLGVAASLVTAVLVALVFRSISAGSNRELIEGITGLVAAGMLFSVSFWLHGKSHLGAWQSYIRDRTTSALATGSLFSLGLLAFLAVYREGAETALFFVGIASSISSTDLGLGILIAVVLLVIAGVLFVRIGAHLPIRPFFLVTSALIFYLGFKFIGTGIHSLQAAQVLPANISSVLPEVPIFGIFPTWETTVPQLIILGLAVLLILLRPRLRRNSAATA